MFPAFDCAVAEAGVRMKTLWEKYQRLEIKGSLIGLEAGEITVPYFCYPVDAQVIGFEGCILYCFLPEYGDMVFAANPESCADRNVYPLAKDFRDFLRLILACGSANPVEQVIWMDKERFESHLREERAAQTEEQKAVLMRLAEALELSPMKEPFEAVRKIQAGFDGSRIRYSDEYYDVLGIERNELANL